jgi:hypothetical protein
MMKHAFAGAALIAALIAAAPASAQFDPTEKCYDCPKPRDHYDTRETIRTVKEVDHSRVIETQSEAPVSPRRARPAQRPQPLSHYDTRQATRTARDVDRSPVIETQHDMQALQRANAVLRARAECRDCPQPREHYDTQETIRSTKDVDHSRVIETQSEQEVSRQVKETNHLIIRENETRVGVIQHNHTIIERVPRYVVRVPVVTTVSYVTQQYRVVETPATVTVPVEYRPPRRCHGKRYGRYDYESCRPLLRVRG